MSNVLVHRFTIKILMELAVHSFLTNEWQNEGLFSLLQTSMTNEQFVLVSTGYATSVVLRVLLRRFNFSERTNRAFRGVRDKITRKYRGLKEKFRHRIGNRSSNTLIIRNSNVGDRSTASSTETRDQQVPNDANDQEVQELGGVVN